MLCDFRRCSWVCLNLTGYMFLKTVEDAVLLMGCDCVAIVLVSQVSYPLNSICVVCAAKE